MICPGCDKDTIPPPDVEQVGSSLDDARPGVVNVRRYIKIWIPFQTVWCSACRTPWTYKIVEPKR